LKPDLKRPASNPLLTICEVHRQIFQGIRDDSPKYELIELLEKAYDMAKRMDAKLREYNCGYDNDWWEENKDYEAIHRGM